MSTEWTDIVSGDGVSIEATLLKDSASFLISPTAVVKAAIVSVDHLTKYTADVTQSKDTAGADWAHSIVMVVMPKTATASITFQGLAYIELQIDEGGADDPKTWFIPVRIITGQIA